MGDAVGIAVSDAVGCKEDGMLGLLLGREEGEGLLLGFLLGCEEGLLKSSVGEVVVATGGAVGHAPHVTGQTSLTSLVPSNSLVTHRWSMLFLAAHEHLLKTLVSSVNCPV